MEVGLAAGLAGPLISGVGSFFGADAAAGNAKIAERAGRVKAEQTSGAYLAELNNVLGNIRSVRAATGSSESPTETAILAKQTKISDRNRKIKEASIHLQADQKAADARLHRLSAVMSLLGGGAKSGLFALDNRQSFGF